MLYEPGNFCEICNQRIESLKTCKMCGSIVCDACRVDDDMCINCYESKCQICGVFLSSRACNTCGKLVCEDHGIKVNEVTLCDNCRKRDE